MIESINPSKEHWHILINPTAGGGLAAKRWEEWSPSLLAVIPHHTLHLSTHPKHLSDLTATAITTSKARHLLIVGGDGALHEVVNGICEQTQVATSEIRVAFLPVGTGNDWIKTYNIPRQFKQWLVMFQAGHVQQQAIGKAYFHEGEKERTAYFINAAGLAFDAFVVRYANSIRRRWMGNRFFYLWAIVRCLFVYRLKPARVEINGENIDNHFYTISCGIGKYSGGGMQITPHADPKNQKLAVTIAGRLSPFAVLLNTYRFYNGTIGEHSRVSLWHSTKIEVLAKSKDSILLEADGEFLGHSPVRLEMSQHQLHFIAPPM